MTTRPAEIGDLRLATVVVNATDMDRAAAFWSAALGYQQPDTIGSDDRFARVEDPEGKGPTVLVQRAKDIPAEPAPVHIDLYTSERDRHVDRLTALGATPVDDWDYPAQHDFIVLRDPEGNEFCVIQVD
ncbi:Glyoxalase/bleomycin resistance protein/dioxygenase [Kribbella flavida DSM 17836]|uniref:Glyoxalase/bleomycin resistance protein/dioxygenase n=1 Tax=Kribbella flavida (strain DSM 17836 / JCM 10339 / NBRC 14399) TaxID=479435 RepID=D2PTX0_KRIFD|nr:VOC family protein [Kribbella flavida]ADB33253.1 Glyoxalase/bleomycin resistance protein/dioxygenase [Kribbella flavida DSM 17836]